MTDVLMIGSFPDDASVIKGGVQASVYGLAQALARRSHRVRVLSLPGYVTGKTIRSATVGGIEVSYLTAPYLFQISSVMHLGLALREIKKFHRPVVHIHGTGLFQTALLALLRLRRIPCMWTLHGLTGKETWEHVRQRRTPGNLGRFLLYSGLEWLSLKLAREMTVGTPYVREVIGRQTYVIPQGIFMEEFVGLAQAGRREPLILSLGVFSPRKGHHLTLEAFASVHQAIPAARLIIAGAVHDTPYRQSLEARTTALGLNDSVSIQSDLPRREIIALLGKAKLLALHSQEESQGIALCEALAAGLPVVATRIGGIPFVVTEGQDGFLVDYGDVEGFGKAMKRLLGDGELHARMAARAVMSARRFNWDGIAESVETIYRSAAGDA